MLFTIATTSYQTTCTISERTFNKRHTPKLLQSKHHHYPLRHGGSSDTALKEESCGCFTVPIAWKAGEGKAAFAARLLFGPPAAPARGKDPWELLGPDQGRGALGSCREIVLITYEGRRPGDTASIRPSKRVQQSQVALTDIYTVTQNASFEKEGRRYCQIISGQ